METIRHQESSRGSVIMVGLAFVVLAAFRRIPIPIMNFDLLPPNPRYIEAGSQVWSSLFALGTVPLLSALLLAELVKLVLPQQAVRGGSIRLGRLLVGIVALLFTVFQGYGLVTGLAAHDIVRNGVDSLVAALACYAGVTAVLIWLSDEIRLPGLENGIWLLLVIPFLDALPRDLVSAFEFFRSSGMPAGFFLLAAGATSAAVVMVILLNNLMMGVGRKGQTAVDIPLEILLWPPFLASVVTNLLMMVPIYALSGLMEAAPWVFAILGSASNCLLIPIIVYGYMRRQPADRREAIRPILVVVAAAQVLIVVGFGLVNAFILPPLLPNGGMLIVCVTVMVSLCRLALEMRALARS